MNIQQLQYILAVDRHRHFAKAAAACFVTQPTLSAMIKKLESELEIAIFDRTKHPIEPTRAGEEILLRAQKVVNAVNGIEEFAREQKGEIKGEIRLSVIPTIAPYLIPHLLKNLVGKYPELRLHIKELPTDQIEEQLLSGETDMGVLATPLNKQSLREIPMYLEEFLVYFSAKESYHFQKSEVAADDLTGVRIWLLEEGHCFRSQVINLCKFRNSGLKGVVYEAGSVETLMNMVDLYGGITIIPRLAGLKLTEEKTQRIRPFCTPKPVREISLVTEQNYPRESILSAIKAEILTALPEEIRLEGEKRIMDF